jgi:hypothetical protein
VTYDKYRPRIEAIELYLNRRAAILSGWNGCRALDIYREPVIKRPWMSVDELIQKMVMFHYPAQPGWPSHITFP